MALTRSERLRAEDLEECGRVGEQFGLGAPEFVARQLDDRTGLRWIGGTGVAIGSIGLFVVWPVVASLKMSPSMGILVIFGVVLVVAWPLIAVGKRFANVSVRQCLYSGGVARIDRKAAEPTVVRWADVESVTIETGDDDGTPTASLIGCTLRGQAIAAFKVHRDIMGYVAVAAHRALAPRIVPAMIATYNSGQPVIAAPNAQVSQWGIVFPRRNRRAWTEISVLGMEHSDAGPNVVTRMDLRKDRKGWWSHDYCDPSGVPNAIFLADLIAYAARQRGVRVDGYAG
jgi:hypothetical protein